MNKETRQKISLAKMGSVPWNKGKIGAMPEPWNKGKKTPLETREKQRAAKLKNPIRYWEGKKRPDMTDDKHWAWLGDKISYRALHAWIERKIGKASECNDCGTESAKRYHWHNIDGKYERNINQFISLCTSCHFKRHKMM